MPPRKAAAVKVEIPIQPTVDASEQNENIPEEVRQSLARWTDEQEIALLKGIVKWKPVGSSTRRGSESSGTTADGELPRIQACISISA